MPQSKLLHFDLGGRRMDWFRLWDKKQRQARKRARPNGPGGQQFVAD
jgi:hypothetical protein